MKKTKEQRDQLRAKYSNVKDFDAEVRAEVLALLDDADEAEAALLEATRPFVVAVRVVDEGSDVNDTRAETQFLSLTPAPEPLDTRTMRVGGRKLRVTLRGPCYLDVQTRPTPAGALCKELPHLTREETRAFTFAESDEEITAFAAGWRARMDLGIRMPHPTCPEGREVHPDWPQVCRVSWERGWEGADALYRRFWAGSSCRP